MTTRTTAARLLALIIGAVTALTGLAEPKIDEEALKHFLEPTD